MGITSAGAAGQIAGTIDRVTSMDAGDEGSLAVAGGCDNRARISESDAGHSAGSRNLVDGLNRWSAAGSPAECGAGTRKTSLIIRGNRAVACQRSYRATTPAAA